MEDAGDGDDDGDVEDAGDDDGDAGNVGGILPSHPSVSSALQLVHQFVFLFVFDSPTPVDMSTTGLHACNVQK